MRTYNKLCCCCFKKCRSFTFEDLSIPDPPRGYRAPLGCWSFPGGAEIDCLKTNRFWEFHYPIWPPKVLHISIWWYVLLLRCQKMLEHHARTTPKITFSTFYRILAIFFRGDFCWHKYQKNSTFLQNSGEVFSEVTFADIDLCIANNTMFDIHI